MSISKIKIGDATHDIVANGLTYCTCSTAADTVAKEATVVSGKFSLFTGATVIVKFTNANSIAAPTLNVGGTGAKPIYRYGTTTASTGTTTTGWVAGAVQMFTYDGAGWIRDYWNNTTYSNASMGSGYTTCSTAAATVAKTASLSSYALTTGGIVSIKFTYDVPASATLNINSKGAKAIYYKGAAITAGVIKAGDIATFIYSSQYHLISLDRLGAIIDEGAGANSIIVGEISTNTAAGDYAYSGGRESVASGDNSHAEGYKATASGSFAYAQGRMTTASGYASHAEGTEAVAKGYASHAEGMGTIAGSSYQHVQGLYNIEDTAEAYLHIVGNGGGSSLRSNAHTLDKDGNAWFAGDVYVGGTDQASGSKLAKASDIPAAYTHPTTSGNKHIPSGGSSGQILRWSADGTAAWGADNNTTYSVVSTTADGLAPKRDGSTTKFLRADGTWAVPPDNNTVYTHPSYTARTGKPTANQTPAFGGTATVSQITSDTTGHVTAATDRTIKIPDTLSNGTGTAGLIKTTSTVTSNSGYTACPVISGVPYYKNTTYTSLKNPNSLTVKGNGTNSFTYDGSAAKTLNIKAGDNVSVSSDTSGNITISAITASADNMVSIVDATGSSNDMDTIFKSGAQVKFYKTNGDTLNTPYKAGLTGTLVGAYILTITGSTTYGKQIAYINGGNYHFERSMSNGTINAWKKIVQDTDLGTQVTYSLSGNALTITTK